MSTQVIEYTTPEWGIQLTFYWVAEISQHSHWFRARSGLLCAAVTLSWVQSPFSFGDRNFLKNTPLRPAVTYFFPSGLVPTRAPLTPTDTPMPDLDRFNLIGPIFMLFRMKNPITHSRLSFALPAVSQQCPERTI